MDTLLCDISAFCAYRIPPCVWELIGGYPDISTSAGRRSLARCAVYLDYLPLPLHELVTLRSERHRVRCIRQHLVSHAAFPIGDVQIGPGLSLVSPMMTLSTLATHLNVERLCMVMYELCGSFSVIRLTPEHRDQLQRRLDSGATLRSGGWSPVLSNDRKLTDLWQRPPLIEFEQLVDACYRARGSRGGANLLRAARAVRGVAASPFEVQAAMLLCGPSHMGGEGFGTASLNRRIPLNGPARDIARRDCCYADIYIESPSADRPVAIECQSRLIHDTAESFISDADRTAALQSMGITVIPLTYRQICDARVYRSVRAHIARELGAEMGTIPDWKLRREDRLRRELFADWTELGT